MKLNPRASDGANHQNAGLWQYDSTTLDFIEGSSKAPASHSWGVTLEVSEDGNF